MQSAIPAFRCAMSPRISQAREHVPSIRGEPKATSLLIASHFGIKPLYTVPSPAPAGQIVIPRPRTMLNCIASVLQLVEAASAYSYSAAVNSASRYVRLSIVAKVTGLCEVSRDTVSVQWWWNSVELISLQG